MTYVISSVVLTLGMLGYGAVSGAAAFLLPVGCLSTPGFVGWSRMVVGLPIAASQTDRAVSTWKVQQPPAADRLRDLDEAMREARSYASSLDDSQLCQAWRRSYTLLQRASTCSQRSAVVLTRQAYLDELADRDPAAITAWLEAGARAAGGPERFMQRANPGS